MSHLYHGKAFVSGHGCLALIFALVKNLYFLFQQVQTVIATALRRAQSGTKMAADIMHGLFTWEQMASHTIAGGNSSKAAFDPDLVQQIIGKR